MNLDDFIGLSEAARLVSRSATVIRRWADRGLVRCERSPYGRIVHREDVLRRAAEVGASRGRA